MSGVSFEDVTVFLSGTQFVVNSDYTPFTEGEGETFQSFIAVAAGSSGVTAPEGLTGSYITYVVDASSDGTQLLSISFEAYGVTTTSEGETVALVTSGTISAPSGGFPTATGTTLAAAIEYGTTGLRADTTLTTQQSADMFTALYAAYILYLYLSAGVDATATGEYVAAGLMDPNVLAFGQDVEAIDSEISGNQYLASNFYNAVLPFMRVTYDLTKANQTLDSALSQAVLLLAAFLNNPSGNALVEGSVSDQAAIDAAINTYSDKWTSEKIAELDASVVELGSTVNDEQLAIIRTDLQSYITDTVNDAISNTNADFETRLTSLEVLMVELRGLLRLSR